MIKLWDMIEGVWRVTPQNVDVGSATIDSQWYAEQGKWAELEGWLIYEEWLEPGDATLGYDNPVVEMHDGRNKAARYMSGTESERADVTRQRLANEITAQVPIYTGTDGYIDPGVEADAIRSGSAAADKKIELDGTDDADLGSFDPTLVVAEADAADVGYSRFSVSIRKLDPWAGAPDDDLGFEAVLEIQSEYEDQGAEARLYVVDAPGDTGAVLPFVQDTTDPFNWRCTSRDGFKWSDPEESCTVHLLWGNGAIQISPDMTCERHNDRQAAAVRYGVAA